MHLPSVTSSERCRKIPSARLNCSRRPPRSTIPAPSICLATFTAREFLDCSSQITKNLFGCFPSKRPRISGRAGQSRRALHYGQGVPKDVKKAALFKDGAEKGKPLCMYFYAMCFDGGVAVEHDRQSARVWHVRAAQGGNRTAIEWCKKNNIPLASPLNS